MKPPPFSYHDPATITEAVELLATLDNAKLLAGGQSLMAMLNMRYAQPDHVIDLNRVEGLSYIRATGDGLEIGAMTRQRDVEFSNDVRRLCPLLNEAMPLVGHRQTRNRGTFGGSLAHFDSSAEIPTVCAGLDAVLRVAGPRGEREIAFKDFPAGYLSTSMELDEVLVSVRLPAWGAGHGFGFEEFARRHGDFAIVSAAALLEAGTDGRITRASLLWAGSVPHRCALPKPRQRSWANRVRWKPSPPRRRWPAESTPMKTSMRRRPTANTWRWCCPGGPLRRRGHGSRGIRGAR